MSKNGFHRNWNSRRRTQSSGGNEEQRYNNQLKEYWTKLGTNFDGFRKKGRFSDVDIKVGNNLFKGHKVILSASSPYFEAMLTNGLREERTSFIEIHDISPATFELILEFIYKGEIDIGVDNVQELLAAANMLQLQQVVNCCCDFLAKQLDASNCIGIFLFAELHVCTNLKLDAKRYVERNFTDVIREEEFLDLPKDTLKNFLKSEGLSIYSEFEVFEATVRWVLKDFESRKSFLSELMSIVRLPVISPKKIDLYIEQCADVELKSCLAQLFSEFKEESKKLLEDNNTMIASSSKNCDMSCDTFFNIRCQPRMCCRKNVYVIGGTGMARNRRRNGESRTLLTVEKLDAFKRQWKLLPSMKYARSCHGIAVLNGLIYVAGGERDSCIFDSVEVFDPIVEEWSTTRSMLSPRSYFGMCTCDDYIYTFGGWIGNNITSSIERFNAHINAWEEYGTMKTPLFAMGVISHNGLIYIIGGFDEFTSVQKLVFSFNPETGQWKQLRSMHEGRAYFGLSILHDFIYVIGGTTNGINASNSVERYSIAENTWTRISCMKIHRISPCLVTINNTLLAIGGNDNVPQTLDSIEMYDPEDNVWRESIQMLTSRYDAAAVVL